LLFDPRNSFVSSNLQPASLEADWRYANIWTKLPASKVFSGGLFAR
jgi:hypothetical protein